MNFKKVFTIFVLMLQLNYIEKGKYLSRATKTSFPTYLAAVRLLLEYWVQVWVLQSYKDADKLKQVHWGATKAGEVMKYLLLEREVEATWPLSSRLENRQLHKDPK